MASLYTKFLDFIGIEESDEQEDDRRDDGYYRDDAPERAAGGAFGAGRAQAGFSARVFWNAREQACLEFGLVAPARGLLDAGGALDFIGALVFLSAQWTLVRING